MAGMSAIDRAWADCERLAGGIGERVAGTANEAKAADLIVAAYEARGLRVSREPFRFVGWQPEGTPALALTVDGEPAEPVRIAPMPFTGSTPVDGVHGLLVPAGVCELVPGLLEWPRFAVVDPEGQARGFVAIVPDGTVRSFPRPERQLLLEPIVIAGADEWEPIAEAVAAGRRVEARLVTRGSYIAELPSQNVIAELRGERPETIIISGHYDTVPGTPGAGDNASGVAGCLALAERFANEKPPKTLRFINWGAHEFGLLGSQFYAQERAQRRELGLIEAAIALDILSDGDRLGVWSGGPALAGPLAELIPAHGGAFPTELYPRGRGETDSWSFAERGIDTVMLLTLPYAHFHLPTDTIANNDPALFAHAVGVAELIVRHLLERPSGSPQSSGSSRLVPATG